MSQLIDSAVSRQFDRLPPHSIESEMCVLASMMLDASKSRQTVGRIVQIVDEESFFQADHAILFGVLKRLYAENRPIDAMIVREELIKRGVLEEIGGLEYLGAILNSVPSAANGAHYAGIVREKSLLRQLMTAYSDGLREIYSPHESAAQVIEDGQRRIFAIAQQKAGRNVSSIETLAHEVFERAELAQRGGGRGVETGFFELDDMLNGLQQQEMIILAARPSMGKTAMVCNMLEHAAGDNQIPCAIFSLEMSKQQLAARMICSRGRIDGHKLRKGMLNDADWRTLTQTVSEISQAPLFVDDSPQITPLDLLARARQLKAEHDIKLFMLDYMQLMDGPGDNRQQQVSEISRAIKAASRELDVPFVALSQLNRNSEGREGHKPRMSDLRESGSIEQDADTILLLHREDYYHLEDPDYMPDNLAEVIIAKQRNGPVGTVKLLFNNRSTRFENLSTQADPF